MKKQIRCARDTIVSGSSITKLGMIDTVTQIIDEVISSDINHLNQLKQEHALLPAGKLYIHRCTGRTNFGYRESPESPEKGIARDKRMINALARKEFLTCKIKSLEKDIARMKRLLSTSANARELILLNRRLRRFDDAGLDLTRILFTEAQNDWIDEFCSPNPYNRENLNYTTGCGLSVRSKSESKIAGLLENLGIPYRYDDLVKIEANGSGNVPHRDTYFADFKIPNFLGGITIHEHFGAFQIENYATNAIKRLNDYHNFDVYELPGRLVRCSEFTFSFEGDLGSNESLKMLIRKILLPF